MDLIEELPYEDAVAFLNDLSPLAPIWMSTGGHADPNRDGANWVFRGQRKADWPLSPTAMRDDAFVHYAIGAAAPSKIRNLTEQLDAEASELRRFIDRCIRAGLPIPEDSQWFRSREILEDAFARGRAAQVDQGVGFPLHITRSLYALAQHHGAPTRFLDWSESPLVAAYFACRKAAEETSKCKKAFRQQLMDNPERRTGPSPPEPPLFQQRMAVWAIRQLAFGYLDEAWRRDNFEPTIDVVRAPYEANPNLRAQKGLFTLVRYHRPRAPEDFRLPPIEEVIARYQKGAHPHLDRPWLRKMTLPYSQAPKLLRFLDQFNINASTIYPSYDSVMPSIREREFWD